MRHPLAVGVKLRNHVHALQQVAVVANNERRAGERLQGFEKLSLRRRVQIVGWFIQQDELGARNRERGKRGNDRLAAREAAHIAGEECSDGIWAIAVHLSCRGEPVGGQGGEDALLNIPVISDGLVEFGGVLAGFHRLQCLQNLCESAELGESLAPPQPQILRQVRHALRRHYRPGVRGQFTQNQPHEGGFTATVIANKAGQRCRKHRRQVAEECGFARVRIRNMVKRNVA